ncbi:hypothetical protein BVX94_00530, partial [bacterium B17]
PIDNPVEGFEPVDTVDWTFIAVTYDQPTTTAEIYVDLDASSTGDDLSFWTDSTADLGEGHTTTSIGSLRPDNNNEPWDGAIDQVFFVSEVLTSNQINDIREAGSVYIPIVPSITNTAVSDITVSSAKCSAMLDAENSVYDIHVFWGTGDGGQFPAQWGNSNFVGRYTNAMSTNISSTIFGLTKGTEYYYAFRGTNASGSPIWAEPSIPFKTIDVPMVNNDAAIPGANYALMTGQETNGGLSDVIIYWGLTDGEEIGDNWDNTNYLGALEEGPFTNSTPTNLLYGLTYYYRCYAANNEGTDWADSTTNFTTLDPGISLGNSVVQDLTANTATLAASLNATSAVLDVYVYWGDNDGGSSEGGWDNTNYVGSYTNNPDIALTYPVGGLTPGGNRYY